MSDHVVQEALSAELHEPGGASSPGMSSEEVGSQGEDAKVLVTKLCLTL